MAKIQYYEEGSTFNVKLDTSQEVAVPTTDHRLLLNRDAPDAHPISAITGLQDALDKACSLAPATNEQIDEAIEKYGEEAEGQQED